MINVTFVTNDGSGMPRSLDVRDEITLEQFLEVNFDGEVDDFTFSVRRNGLSQEAHSDYILEDGDRLCAAPSRIKGENS